MYGLGDVCSTLLADFGTSHRTHRTLAEGDAMRALSASPELNTLLSI